MGMVFSVSAMVVVIHISVVLTTNTGTDGPHTLGSAPLLVSCVCREEQEDKQHYHNEGSFKPHHA